MLYKIKIYLTQESSFYTVLFSFLAIGAWAYNGMYGGKFSLSDLMQVYAFIISHLTIKHGIDSKYNSEMGVKP
jgi:hypothetical protein